MTIKGEEYERLIRILKDQIMWNVYRELIQGSKILRSKDKRDRRHIPIDWDDGNHQTRE